MKTLGAPFLLLLISGLCSNLNAQPKQPSVQSGAADPAIVAAWAEADNHPNEARIENDRLILPTDDRSAMCAYLRVYRMKRETPGSDITRPAGYTTCVPTSQFNIMKSSGSHKPAIR
jgi:hypothetical protein